MTELRPPQELLVAAKKGGTRGGIIGGIVGGIIGAVIGALVVSYFMHQI